MGKRELVLIIVFATAGAVTWRVTAPPAAPGEQGFSFRRVWQGLRAGVGGDRAEHQVRVEASAPATAVMNGLGIAVMRSDVTVTGHDADTVIVTVEGIAYGPDPAGARARAGEVAARLEPAGDRLDLRLDVPTAGRLPVLKVLARVPRRFALHVRDHRGDLEAAGVAAVEIDGRGGDVRITDVAGTVRGVHRGGRVEVARAGSVTYETRRVELRIDDVAGPVECRPQEGRLEIGGVAGATRVVAERTEVVLRMPGGRVDVEASDGSVDVRAPRQPVVLDGRRARLTLALSGPVDVRVTAEDAPVLVRLADGLGATLDLEAQHAEIRVPEGAPAPRREADTVRARGTLHPGGATIVVRTERGDIEIRR